MSLNASVRQPYIPEFDPRPSTRAKRPRGAPTKKDKNQRIVAERRLQRRYDEMQKSIEAESNHVDMELLIASKENPTTRTTEAVEYALTWLDHKELFVSAWVNDYTHYKQVNTLRVEGMHQVLKQCLGGSQKDLFTVTEKMMNLMHRTCRDEDKSIDDNKIVLIELPAGAPTDSSLALPVVRKSDTTSMIRRTMHWLVFVTVPIFTAWRSCRKLPLSRRTPSSVLKTSRSCERWITLTITTSARNSTGNRK